MKSAKTPPPHDLVGRWLHAYEEDGDEGQVYRRDDAELPLSRRPRESLELRADGSATMSVAGEDDRARAQRAAWREEAGEIVVRLARASKGAREVRVRRKSGGRIVIQREGA
ncbi:MAG: hypothetical protein HOP12_03730 [Candidatus Eisenbacteria bacterium]|uniref:TIGR03067 domain-containing protein n=1 Tax=Eiseniibacteriota bacterium TaxID=2212470 RepID=A0A849SFL7_UNCEI|nr:hypothetical protein [Candidatus Eisenbacteria bacterium]